MTARHLRRLLEGAQRAQGSRQRPPSGPDRRRLVRRRGLLWPVPDVPRAEGEQPRSRRRSSSGPGRTAGGPAAMATGSARSRSARRRVQYYRTEVELPFFNYYLKDKGRLDLPRALAFETGRNAWRRSDAVAARADLAEKRSTFRPAASSPSSRLPPQAPPRSTRTSATLQGRCPTPPNCAPLRASSSWSRTSGSRGAAPTSCRTRSDPLAEDLTVAGPIIATLHVSTTGTDSDWVVKLIDVYPDDAPIRSPTRRMSGWAATRCCWLATSCAGSSGTASRAQADGARPGHPDRVRRSATGTTRS